MKIGLKGNVNEKVKKILKEVESLGFIPETNLDMDHVEITTFGGAKEILIQPKITFTFYCPDNFLEMKGE